MWHTLNPKQQWRDITLIASYTYRTLKISKKKFEKQIIEKIVAGERRPIFDCLISTLLHLLQIEMKINFSSSSTYALIFNFHYIRTQRQINTVDQLSNAIKLDQNNELFNRTSHDQRETASKINISDHESLMYTRNDTSFIKNLKIMNGFNILLKYTLLVSNSNQRQKFADRLEIESVKKS